MSGLDGGLHFYVASVFGGLFSRERRRRERREDGDKRGEGQEDWYKSRCLLSWVASPKTGEEGTSAQKVGTFKSH